MFSLCKEHELEIEMSTREIGPLVFNYYIALGRIAYLQYGVFWTLRISFIRYALLLLFYVKEVHRIPYGMSQKQL